MESDLILLMREQLPKVLQYFYLVPWWLSFILGWLTFIFAIAGYKTDPAISLNVLLLSFVFLILFIGKSLADSKIKKLRLGKNPLYLLKKCPNNLDGQVKELEKQKFRIITQTKTTAQFEKNPYFSWISLIVLFLFGAFPAIIYVVWYFLQPKETVFLDIETQK